MTVAPIFPPPPRFDPADSFVLVQRRVDSAALQNENREIQATLWMMEGASQAFGSPGAPFAQAGHRHQCAGCGAPRLGACGYCGAP